MLTINLTNQYKNNTAHVDFSEKSLSNVNSLSAVQKHFKTKIYVDDAIDGTRVVINLTHINPNYHSSIIVPQISVKVETIVDNHVAIEGYAVSLSENDRISCE